MAWPLWDERVGDGTSPCACSRGEEVREPIGVVEALARRWCEVEVDGRRGFGRIVEDRECMFVMNVKLGGSCFSEGSGPTFAMVGVIADAG